MIEPPEFKGSHPVQTDHFEVRTPAITELRCELGVCMDAGFAGLVVIGPSRTGKSSDIRYVKKHKLPQKAIPIVSMRMHRETYFTKNQFYERLLRKFGHGDPVSGTAEDKHDRLVNFLNMLAVESETGRIYVLIDDAHELEERQFAFLCNLYDDLFDERKVQACIVLFAEPKIEGRINGLRGRGKTQTIARLMSKKFYLPLITDAKTVTEILAGYDEASEFPPGSGWAYSQYYYPEAYARNWRLASQGELLFEAFKQAHEKSGVIWPFMIPMESLVRAVKYALVAYRNRDADFIGYTFAQLETAVMFSGYISASDYLNPPKKRKPPK